MTLTSKRIVEAMRMAAIAIMQSNDVTGAEVIEATFEVAAELGQSVISVHGERARRDCQVLAQKLLMEFSTPAKVH